MGENNVSNMDENISNSMDNNNNDNVGHMSDTTVENEYGADQIQILEGLEAVRKRPGMYIGTTSSRGLHHLVYEIVDNAVDEALAGYCDTIDVTINEDNSITVVDNGRGIPVGINHKSGKPAVEVVFTILHAGGKFGGGGYKVSGGLHGVGASVVNALSTWLEVEIYHEGRIYKQRYERGKACYSLQDEGPCDDDKTGTKVTFLPDPEIFQETTRFEFDVLMQRLREMAFLTKGIKIRLTDCRKPEDHNEEENGEWKPKTKGTELKEERQRVAPRRAKRNAAETVPAAETPSEMLKDVEAAAASKASEVQEALKSVDIPEIPEATEQPDSLLIP